MPLSTIRYKICEKYSEYKRWTGYTPNRLQLFRPMYLELIDEYIKAGGNLPDPREEEDRIRGRNKSTMKYMDMEIFIVPNLSQIKVYYFDEIKGQI